MGKICHCHEITWRKDSFETKKHTQKKLQQKQGRRQQLVTTVVLCVWYLCASLHMVVLTFDFEVKKSERKKRFDWIFLCLLIHSLHLPLERKWGRIEWKNTKQFSCFLHFFHILSHESWHNMPKNNSFFLHMFSSKNLIKSTSSSSKIKRETWEFSLSLQKLYSSYLLRNKAKRKQNSVDFFLCYYCFLFYLFFICIHCKKS